MGKSMSDRFEHYFLTSGLIAMSFVATASAVEPQGLPGPVVNSLGKREVILGDNQFGLRYFPDGCMGVVSTIPRVRLLVAAGVSTCLLDGPSMISLKSLGVVLKPGDPDSFDNGYAGVNGVAREPKSNDLLAYYHAEDQKGLLPIPGGIPGFYCSIGLAISKDDGLTFQKVGPVITSCLAKNEKGFTDQGCGEVSIVLDHGKQFLHAYYTEHSRINRRGVQICAARCPAGDAGKTGAWKKYFRGEFEQPGLGGKDEPVISALAMKADALFPHVVYLEQPDRYLMAFNINAYEELAQGVEARTSGIYLASSQDGIRWSKPTLVLSAYAVPFIDKEIGCHPTLMIESCDNSTMSGWLYYAYSERWGHAPPSKPHCLVGQSIRISLP